MNLWKIDSKTVVNPAEIIAAFYWSASDSKSGEAYCHIVLKATRLQRSPHSSPNPQPVKLNATINVDGDDADRLWKRLCDLDVAETS